MNEFKDYSNGLWRQSLYTDDVFLITIKRGFSSSSCITELMLDCMIKKKEVLGSILQNEIECVNRKIREIKENE